MVSNVVYFHPYLGKIPIFTNIFQMGWNHQPVLFLLIQNSIPFEPSIPSEERIHIPSHLRHFWVDDLFLFFPFGGIWICFQEGWYLHTMYLIWFFNIASTKWAMKKTGCLEYNVGIILPKYTRDCFITIIYITWLNKQYFMFKSPAKLFSWLKWKVGGFY